MKLQILGANRTLLTLANGTEVFFSYETPVAGRYAEQYFRTDQKCSMTTSKMIGEYLRRKTDMGNYPADVVEQSWIEALLDR